MTGYRRRTVTVAGIGAELSNPKRQYQTVKDLALASSDGRRAAPMLVTVSTAFSQTNTQPPSQSAAPFSNPLGASGQTTQK
ncbi:MAG: hypothetical protein R6W89_01530, partial [Candidatus Hydrogenedentota bacterium]